MRVFLSKIEDSLDVAINVIGDNTEHKRMNHPYVPPQVKTAAETEIETQATNDEFTNDAATEQKKQTKITDLVDDIIDKKTLFKRYVVRTFGLKMILFIANIPET